MGGIATRFEALRHTGRKAFIPFLTAGFPDAGRFRALLAATADADFVEIGLPFSDPVADGPSICQASEVALAQGMHPDALFDLLQEETTHPPAILMTYLNPVLAYGTERFFGRAARCGIAAILLTDVPADEGEEWRAAARAAGLDTVLLVAPTTAPERLGRIAGAATGFVYCVAVMGTTGARAAVHDVARETVARVRAQSAAPVVVGFGISTPEQVREVCGFADGVVVGSALVDLIQAYQHDPQLVPLFRAQVRALARAAHGD